MESLSLWGRTVRRVEEFFKRIIAHDQCLCPLDSRILGSAPWMCIVCSDLRRRLRGEKHPRNAIITGGKRHNRRGPTRVWLMAQRVDEKWVYPSPVMAVTQGWLVLKRRKIFKALQEKADVNVTPAFITRDGVLGLLAVGLTSGQRRLFHVRSDAISVELSGSASMIFFVHPSLIPLPRDRFRLGLGSVSRS